MWDYPAYGGLLIASFGAATLLPLQSEAVLVGLLLTERFPTALLVIIATVGNVLGSMVNWWLGRSIERLRHRSWFPVSDEKLTKAQQLYRRYGRWTLLASWVPIIGDPLTLAAGVMREPLRSFIWIVTLAKAGRYLALTAITLSYLT